ncbi:MAG TPA: hypothetical protein VIL97_00795 [Thermoanaerobaculia bacterium]
MAKLNEGIGLVVGVQSAEGTINPEVQVATIIANTDDGSVLSANEALGVPIRDGSLRFDIGRVEDENPVVPGSFTRTPGSFLRAEVSTFQFDLAIKGSGKTNGNPVLAGDFNLREAMEALLKGAGIIRGTPTTSATPYVLGGASVLTFKVWRRDSAFTVQDCRIKTVSFKLTPGGIVIATFTVAPGAVALRDPDTFPTSISYGSLLSTKAPVLQGAAAQWAAGTVRGFLSGTLTIDNEFEEFPDSNATTGVINEMTGRRISWSGPFYNDDTSDTQDFSNLIRESTFANADMRFELGTAQPGVGAINNSLRFELEEQVVTAQKFSEQAGKVVWDLETYATKAASANGEAVITSR